MRSLPGSSSNFIQTLIYFFEEEKEEKKIAYKRVCDANSIRRAVDGKLFKCEPEQGEKIISERCLSKPSSPVMIFPVNVLKCPEVSEGNNN